MEKIEDIVQKDFIAEVTILKKPKFVEILRKKRAVIAGEDGCYIINPITNKKKKNITTCSCSHLWINSNKKTIALFLKQRNILNIYDTKTYKKKLSIKNMDLLYAVTFHPTNTTILLEYSSYFNNDVYSYHKIYDYELKKDKGNFVHDQPTMNSFSENNLDIIHINRLIAIARRLKNCKFDRDTYEKLCNNNLLFVSMSENNGNYCIQYWNTQTKKLIHQVPLLDCTDCSHFSFSPNEKQLLIVLDNRCITLNIPWFIKINKIFTYWALKNLDPSLPSDVLTLLIPIINS
jgi:hypothetical protein